MFFKSISVRSENSQTKMSTIRRSSNVRQAEKIDNFQENENIYVEQSQILSFFLYGFFKTLTSKRKDTHRIRIVRALLIQSFLGLFYYLWFSLKLCNSESCSPSCSEPDIINLTTEYISNAQHPMQSEKAAFINHSANVE